MKHCKLTILCLLNIYIELVTSNILNKTVFIIRSQSHPFHAQISDETKSNLKSGLLKDGISNPKVFDLHNDLNVPGGWSIYPLLPLLEKYLDENHWFVFLNENSDVNLEILKELFSKYSSDYGIFVGHALENTDVPYPDFSTGFLISRELLRLFHLDFFEVNSSERKEVTSHQAYLLAKEFESLGSILEHDSRLCVQIEKGCAIAPRKIPSCNMSTEKQVGLLQQTLFAIKTCANYYKSRLQIVKETWARVALNIVYVSDEEDESKGTVVLPGSEKGHCEKTESIFKFFHKESKTKNLQWLVIVDDDSMFSISKYVNMVGCYVGQDHTSDEQIAIAERYGYMLASSQVKGFDFPTGGGGMIFNAKAVQKIVSGCACPKTTADFGEPDDIFIGKCLHRHNIPIIHCERLHQQIPEYYDEGQLLRQDPVSFHKFIDTDPYKNYDKWFRDSDEKLIKLTKQFKKETKEEL